MGKSAGPFRNRAMVQIADTLVKLGYFAKGVGFPAETSPGTQGCMALMRRARIPVKAHQLHKEHFS